MWAYPVITLLELLPGVVSFQLERQKGGLSHVWKDGQVKRQEHTIWLITSELWCFPDSKCQGMLYFKTNPAPNIGSVKGKRSVFDMAARNCSHPLKFEIFSSKNAKMQNANGCLERLIPERGVRGNTFEAILNYCQSTAACWVRILIFISRHCQMHNGPKDWVLSPK